MPHSVRRRDVDRWFLAAGICHQVTRRATAVVDEEDRLQVRLHRSHQRQPVGHGSGHRVLVRKHDAVFGWRQPECPDQPALDVRSAVNGWGLFLIHVEGRLGVGQQHAGLAPFGQ